MANLNSTAVVTVKRGWRRLRDTQISQEIMKPNNLSSGMSHITILSLGSGTCSNRITKKHAEVKTGLVISDITSLIRINISY
ncbi:hypothetical protein CsSME_00028319 [Camellia sinensis var. sinensis]